VYAALLERMHLKGYRFSRLGLRDGILAQMLADTDVRTSAHRTMEAERWEGVLEVCRRYGVDPRKVEPERQHAVQLFDQLETVHQLPVEYRLWIQAAAMMQEVGKYMNHQGHHRHTQYIIANSEIFGFSPAQRAIVAAIARYLGKSRPEAMDRPMRYVPVEEHAHVRSAIVLLRLAGADQGVSEACGAGADSGAGRGGAGAVVAEERGGLFPRGLSARALGGSGVEGANDAGINQ